MYNNGNHKYDTIDTILTDLCSEHQYKLCVDKIKFYNNFRVIFININPIEKNKSFYNKKNLIFSILNLVQNNYRAENVN